jgi:hypothetical protein
MAETGYGQQQQQQQLRASEFAATLNGENPRAILKVLRQFVKILRTERRVALSLKRLQDDDNDDSSVDCDDDFDVSLVTQVEKESNDVDPHDGQDVEEPPAKKYKKSDHWKMDTSSYQVPFVGTAVARGELAPVHKGEWPTGLLKAYLQKSPMATELLSDALRPSTGALHKSLFKKRQVKLSRAICKAHVLALAGLVTAAIPIEKLCESDSFVQDNRISEQNSWTKFLPTFAKEAIPWIFEILNEETGKGRGKMGELGGCGSLVVPVFKILQNLARISTAHARNVARRLDENLSDGVIRICLRPLPLKRNDDSTENVEENATRLRKKQSRTEAVKLASMLLQNDDPVTYGYVCTIGNRERKFKAGIVYIALREGLESLSVKNSNEKLNVDDSYLHAVADLLDNLRRIIFSQSSRLGNVKLNFELISKDPLQHVSKVTAFAPRLAGGNSFHQVLMSADQYDEYTALTKVGIEARRLLFHLLSDRSRSPMLVRGEGQPIARCLIRLLESPNATQNLRQFIAFCLKSSPFLVKDVFRMITFPDPRSSYDFVSRIGFVITVLREGPPLSECLAGIHSSVSEDDLLATLIPIKLKGQILAKALQKGNSIVKMECFKLVVAIVERCNDVKRDKNSMLPCRAEIAAILSTCMTDVIPDSQFLLSFHGKFEKKSVPGALLMTQYLQSLDAVVTLSRDLNQDSFDATKLLPLDAAEFNGFVPRVQVGLLTFIREFVLSRQPNVLALSKSVIQIMLTTNDTNIYSLCYDIVTTQLTRFLLPLESDDELREYIGQEIAIWISSLTSATMTSFFRLIDRVSIHHLWSLLAFVGKAWKKHKGNRKMNFSFLLVAALSDNDHSTLFVRFVGQAAARCMFILKDPLPLAEVIIHGGEQGLSTASSGILKPLVEYARLLVNLNLENRANAQATLGNLLCGLFTKDSAYVHVFGTFSNLERASLLECCPVKGPTGICDQIVRIQLVHFLNHIFIVLSHTTWALERYRAALWYLLPMLLQVRLFLRSCFSNRVQNIS